MHINVLVMSDRIYQSLILNTSDHFMYSQSVWSTYPRYNIDWPESIWRLHLTGVQSWPWSGTARLKNNCMVHFIKTKLLLKYIVIYIVFD